MKTKILVSFVCAFAFLSLLSSCSTSYFAEKRHYTKGYSIEALRHKKRVENVKNANCEGIKIQGEAATSAFKLNDEAIDGMFKNSLDISEETAKINAGPDCKEENAGPKIVAPSSASFKEQKSENENALASLTQGNLPLNSSKPRIHSDEGWALNAPPAEGSNQTMAILGVVFGAVSCIGFQPVFSLAAIVLSLVALSKIKKNPAEYGGKTMATIGLVLGIATFVFWTAVLLFYFALLFSMLGWQQ